jgi:hypothetical protein
MNLGFRRLTGVSFATLGTLGGILHLDDGVPTGTSLQVEAEWSPQSLGSP